MTPPAWCLRTTADAEALISEIRRAVRRSKRTGGGYGVYRRADDGRPAVAIEVCIRTDDIAPPGRRAARSDP